MACTAGAKCFLIIFNLFFFLLGGAVLGAGIFIIVGGKSYVTDVIDHVPMGDDAADTVDGATSLLTKAAYCLIGAGAFVFIIGFLGCCGAIMMSKCMLLTYAVLVTLILLVQLAAAIAVIVFKEKAEEKLKDFLISTIEDRYNGASYGSGGDLEESFDVLTAAWDYVQVSFECCGVSNFSDFAGATEWNNTMRILDTNGGNVMVDVDAVVPPTCCIMVDSDLFPTKMDEITFVDLHDCLTTASAASTHQDTCYDAVLDLLMEYSTIVMGVGLGVALVELIGLIAACCLISVIRKSSAPPPVHVIHR